MALPCGHHEACSYRYRHRGESRKYCLACVVENSGIPSVPEMIKQQTEKEKPKEKKVKKEENKVVAQCHFFFYFMRKYEDIYRDYCEWVVSKTGNAEYDYDYMIENRDEKQDENT